MVAIQTRLVQIDDAPELVKLIAQMGYHVGEEEMRNRIDFYLHNPNYTVWVALQDGNICGLLAAMVIECFHRDERFCRIDALVVDEQSRRQGVGKVLMQVAEKFALDQDCSWVELTSGVHREKMGSHQFYHSLGYEELNDLKKYLAKRLHEGVLLSTAELQT